MGKKGMVMWEVIVMAVIAILVMMFVIMIFKQNISKEGKTVGNKVGSLSSDKDCDGVPDALDRCCDTKIGAEVDSSGCNINNELPKPCSVVEQKNC